MASPTKALDSSGPASTKTALLIVGLIVVIAIAAYFSYQAMPRSGGVTGVVKQNPQFDFLTAKAKECQGDFSRLSPEDQQKVNEASHGRGAEYMARAWGSMQKAAKR